MLQKLAKVDNTSPAQLLSKCQLSKSSTDRKGQSYLPIETWANLSFLDQINHGSVAKPHSITFVGHSGYPTDNQSR